MSYEPQPIDTTHVTLSAEMRQLTERLAENAHEHWARQRLAEGWTYGPTRDDVKQEHPCLVPYAALPDAEKQYDRLTAMETLKTIMALGYRLELPSQHAAPASGPTREEDVMSEPRVDDILQQVQAPDTNLLGLLEQYQSAAYAHYWQQDIRLYRTFGRALISAGHPTRGFELVRAGLEAYKDTPAWHDDPELRYLRAWALARGGSAAKALEYVEQLLQGSVLDQALEIEALSLAGSLYKGRYTRTTNSALKGEYAAQLAKYYKLAYQRCADSFPGINAATMSLLASQGEEARDLAQRTLAHVISERQQPDKEHDHWLLATFGEVYLHLGNQPEAARWYHEAVQQAAGRIGDIASMRRQVQLLAEKMVISADILRLFDIGHVVVFSGHMLDHPIRATEGQLSPRFPPDTALEHRVKLAIKDALDALNATVGYSSVACGSDILFADRCWSEKKSCISSSPSPRKTSMLPVSILACQRCLSDVSAATGSWTRPLRCIMRPRRPSLAMRCSLSSSTLSPRVSPSPVLCSLACGPMPWRCAILLRHFS